MVNELYWKVDYDSNEKPGFWGYRTLPHLPNDIVSSIVDQSAFRMGRDVALPLHSIVRSHQSCHTLSRLNHWSRLTLFP